MGAVNTLINARCSFFVGNVDTDANIICPLDYALGIEDRMHFRGRRSKYTPSDLVIYNKSTGYLHVIYKSIIFDETVAMRMRNFQCARCALEIGERNAQGEIRWKNDAYARRDPLEKMFGNDIRVCKYCYQLINNGIFAPLKNGPLLPVLQKVQTTVQEWLKSRVDFTPDGSPMHADTETSNHITDILFGERVSITLPPPLPPYFDNGNSSPLFGSDIHNLLNNNDSNQSFPGSIDDYANDLIETTIPKQQNVAELLGNPEVKNFCIEFARYVIKTFGGGLATTNVGMDTTWDYWLQSINKAEGKYIVFPDFQFYTLF